MTDIRNKKIDEEMLSGVSGGTTDPKTQNVSLGKRKSLCPKCKEEKTFDLFLGGRAICEDCGFEKFM